MSDRITQIADHVRAKAPGLIEDLREQIEAAALAVSEASQERDDAPARVTISIAVKWDLGSNAVNLKAGVSVKHTAEADVLLDDPNQPTLPGVEGQP